MKPGSHTHHHDLDAEWALEPLPPFSLEAARAAVPVRTRESRLAMARWAP